MNRIASPIVFTLGTEQEVTHVEVEAVQEQFEVCMFDLIYKGESVMGNPIFKSSASLVEIAQAEQVLATEVAGVIGTATIMVEGVVMTAAQLGELFGGHVAEINALITSKAQIHDQVLKQKSSRVTAQKAAQAIKAWVAGAYGASSPQATTLGFQPPNRHPASAATKVEAQAKSKATREERHTMGKRQKASIHGTASAPPSPAAPSTTGNTGNSGH
jgi:hypothetical protein